MRTLDGAVLDLTSAGEGRQMIDRDVQNATKNDRLIDGVGVANDTLCFTKQYLVQFV